MRSRIFLAAIALLLIAPRFSTAIDFVAFETGPVRPLAIRPDGFQLYAVNIPDNQLQVFDITDAGLILAGSVQVGMEPCAVAVAPDGKVWVVNHLSDSISIVDVSASPPRVVQTLIVGDEPRDIVFAGTGGTRAFVTTAMDSTTASRFLRAPTPTIRCPSRPPRFPHCPSGRLRRWASPSRRHTGPHSGTDSPSANEISIVRREDESPKPAARFTRPLSRFAVAIV
jgi:YVTN family beta-propeller protein